MTSISFKHLSDRIIGFDDINKTLDTIESDKLRNELRVLLFDYIFNIWRQILIYNNGELVSLFKDYGLDRVLKEDISTFEQSLKYHLIVKHKGIGRWLLILKDGIVGSYKKLRLKEAL
jgi:hypothetical protein